MFPWHYLSRSLVSVCSFVRWSLSPMHLYPPSVMPLCPHLSIYPPPPRYCASRSTLFCSPSALSILLCRPCSLLGLSSAAPTFLVVPIVPPRTLCAFCCVPPPKRSPFCDSVFPFLFAWHLEHCFRRTQKVRFFGWWRNPHPWGSPPPPGRGGWPSHQS